MSAKADHTIALALSEMILDRETFRARLSKLDETVAQLFLTGGRDAHQEWTEIAPLLRYADVLSHSPQTSHRETAYLIAALLRELDEAGCFSQAESEKVSAFIKAYLIELGNFPALATLERDRPTAYTLPMLRTAEKVAKEVLHKTYQGGAVFTDAQFEIVSKLRGQDYFSFSGPTSLGKSFIIKDYLLGLASREDLDDKCIVVLVPTRALISQTVADLRVLLREVPQVHVAAYPHLPLMVRQRHRRTVFVFTPERLIRYLRDATREVEYLIVDEAHKVVAAQDARSSLFYHSISETLRLFATNLLFSSPGIANPELLLELFDKSPTGAVALTERTVGQQRYFVDLQERKQYWFSSLETTPHELDTPPMADDLIGLIKELSQASKSIIYVNGSIKAAELAVQLAQPLPRATSTSIRDAATKIREIVHPKYYLSDTLGRGVAFHHGKMPQEAREIVESMFADADSGVQFIVCTSTLLEGVNLPAKNIFMVSDKNGSRKLSRIDFENLAGRAGRLTFDFSGNVICVRSDSSAWEETTQALIPRPKPQDVSSFLVRPAPAKKKEYTDIEKVLSGVPLPKSTTEERRRIARQYATILLADHEEDTSSRLRTNFVAKVPQGIDVLRKAAARNSVPSWILRRNPSIPVDLQNRALLELQETREPLLPESQSLLKFDTCYRSLQRLSRAYDWPNSQSHGNDDLLSKNMTVDSMESRLRYWAMLMHDWVHGHPVNMTIRRAIQFHADRGWISYRDFQQQGEIVREDFDGTNLRHINLIIEWTLQDLEKGLRFTIMTYMQNFQDLTVEVLGSSGSGLDFSALLEYGSADSRNAQLQQAGLSRTAALEILRDHAECLILSEGGEVQGLRFDDVLNRDDVSKGTLRELRLLAGYVTGAA